MLVLIEAAAVDLDIARYLWGTQGGAALLRVCEKVLQYGIDANQNDLGCLSLLYRFDLASLIQQR